MSSRVIDYSFFLICLILASFGVFSLVKTCTVDGRIDYCYVDTIRGATGGYEVIGHRLWRSDAHLGVAESPDRANIIMQNSVSCPK